MIRRAALVLLGLVLGAVPLRAQDAAFTVTVQSANVHKSPSTGGAVIGRVTRGQAFEVTRELGSWVRIAWPDGEDGAGYLHVTWGRLSRGVEAAPLRQAAERPSVSSDQSVGPGTGAPAAVPPSVPRRVPARTPVLLPSHAIGLGGRMGSAAFGFAASGRAWSRKNIGVQLEVSRSTETSLALDDRVSTLQFAPSVIYSPDDFVSDAFWVRPYVGGGVSVARSKRTVVSGSELTESDGGLGYQAFGGAEVTWANVPALAISADVRQLWRPAPFDGTYAGHLGLSVAVHWYVR